MTSLKIRVEILLQVIVTTITGKGAGKVTQGTSKGVESGAEPNSVYEQFDSKGNLMKRYFYDDQGRMISRQDFTGKPHYDKVTGQYLDKHQHNYSYDSYGNRKEISLTEITE
jgi:hypothetical protein